MLFAPGGVEQVGPEIPALGAGTPPVPLHPGAVEFHRSVPSPARPAREARAPLVTSSRAKRGSAVRMLRAIVRPTSVSSGPDGSTAS
ncbi:hypothetical protein [Pseudonocardia ammonioxydans]|uniref:hypothetical protein n=1 Tax=Pseudonocardia ammonioxydans TaxID=260086 RepID=UPI0015A5CF3A|nr:hypothetical protein [Pseudonocardia ammonioxydans]